MSFETVILDVEKDVKLGVADALKVISAVQTKSPAGVVALTALAGAIETALGSVAETNVSTLSITLPSDIADFKAVWTEGKALLESIGVK